MDDGTGTDQQRRAIVEAQRMMRWWRSAPPEPPPPLGGAELDDLEWRAAALEVTIEHLERRLAPILVSLGHTHPVTGHRRAG